MSLYNYVDHPNSNLICCICRTPFTNPATTTTCVHTFCKECILRAIEHSPQCPVDRFPLSPDNLAPANPIVRSLVDELAVECVHRPEGCMHICQRQLLHAHLLDSCLYREVACPQGICTETMSFKDSLEHHHEGDQKYSDTLRPTTLVVEVPSNNKFGEDRPESPPPLTLPAISSSLSDTSGPQTPPIRLSVLAEQNVLLRHRVDTLENLLHAVRREMGTIKHALGPWYRLEAASNAFREGVSGYSPSDLPSRRESTALVSPLNTGSANAEIRTPREHQPDYPSRPLGSALTAASASRADSLAAYFPDELPADEGAVLAPASLNSQSGLRPPGSSMHPQHRIPLSVDYMNYDAQNPHLSVRHPSLVAPLNLGTTLEGTLHGLRESVMGLAASVDSMGRRNEIALSSEAARLAEEVGGLRAGVHGLRMQVHAIMMDRNAQLTGRDGLGDGLQMNGQWTLPFPQPPLPPSTRLYHPQSSPSITKL